MKTLIAMLALCGVCLTACATDKKPATAAKPTSTATKPAPTAAAAKERQARQRLAMDFRRVVDKLSADEVAAVKAVVAKHQAAKPTAKPATPAKKK